MEKIFEPEVLPNFVRVGTLPDNSDQFNTY